MLRYEFKYIISVEREEEVRARLAPFLEFDSFAARNGGEYTVRSIYFDTPDFECYTTKIAGIKKRKKLRIRGYNRPDRNRDVFFEIKKKFHHPILKHRYLSDFEEMQDIFETGEIDGEAVDLNRFMYYIHAQQMHPVVTVIYEREAYEAPTADVNNRLRVTFDKNLRALPYPRLDELYREEGAVAVMPGEFILEIKFNNFQPAWISEILHDLNLKREPASKYCMSIDALEEINPQGRFDALIFNRLNEKGIS